MRLNGKVLASVVAGSLLAAAPAGGIVHLWDIAEIYSNEDGSVQFVELFTKSPSEPATQASELASDTNNVTLLGPVAQPTTNHSFLLATPGFADLPGAVVPDTILPVAPFFSVDGDTLAFRYLGADVDVVTFLPGELPLDGVTSLHRQNPGGISGADPPGGLFPAENSPTNYAGDAGHLMLPEPSVHLLGATALLILCASRAGRRRGARYQDQLRTSAPAARPCKLRPCGQPRRAGG